MQMKSDLEMKGLRGCYQAVRFGELDATRSSCVLTVITELFYIYRSFYLWMI